MNPQQVAELLRRSLPDALIEVRSEDDTHFAARLVSPVFEGLRALARHQHVYRALGELVGREIHALSIEAYTPQEWAAAPGSRAGGSSRADGSGPAGGSAGSAGSGGGGQDNQRG